jgi:hypothetical protein
MTYSQCSGRESNGSFDRSSIRCRFKEVKVGMPTVSG